MKNKGEITIIILGIIAIVAVSLFVAIYEGNYKPIVFCITIGLGSVICSKTIN